MAIDSKTPYVDPVAFDFMGAAFAERGFDLRREIRQD